MIAEHFRDLNHNSYLYVGRRAAGPYHGSSLRLGSSLLSFYLIISIIVYGIYLFKPGSVGNFRSLPIRVYTLK